MSSTVAYPARRTRNGSVVVVTDPTTARDLIGELVDLIGPDGTVAHGRVAAVGRTWADTDGTTRVYAYIDPTSLITAAA